MNEEDLRVGGYYMSVNGRQVGHIIRFGTENRNKSRQNPFGITVTYDLYEYDGKKSYRNSAKLESFSAWVSKRVKPKKI